MSLERFVFQRTRAGDIAHLVNVARSVRHAPGYKHTIPSGFNSINKTFRIGKGGINGIRPVIISLVDSLRRCSHKGSKSQSSTKNLCEPLVSSCLCGNIF
jgi:hypothetical protein